MSYTSVSITKQSTRLSSSVKRIVKALTPKGYGAQTVLLDDNTKVQVVTIHTDRVIILQLNSKEIEWTESDDTETIIEDTGTHLTLYTTNPKLRKKLQKYEKHYRLIGETDKIFHIELTGKWKFLQIFKHPIDR